MIKYRNIDFKIEEFLIDTEFEKYIIPLRKLGIDNMEDYSNLCGIPYLGRKDLIELVGDNIELIDRTKLFIMIESKHQKKVNILVYGSISLLVLISILFGLITSIIW